jgi:hypothetical protein
MAMHVVRVAKTPSKVPEREHARTPHAPEVWEGESRGSVCVWERRGEGRKEADRVAGWDNAPMAVCLSSSSF